MKKPLAERQAAMRARPQKRGRPTKFDHNDELAAKACFVLDLAKRCVEQWLREGLDTVTIACRLRDAFSPHYVNVEKVEKWVRACELSAFEANGIVQ